MMYQIRKYLKDHKEVLLLTSIYRFDRISSGELTGHYLDRSGDLTGHYWHYWDRFWGPLLATTG